MPTYGYICPKCGQTTDVVKPMRESDREETCSCGGLMARDYHASPPNIGDREYRRPIHSDALAIMPHQVEDHKKRHPNVRLDKECRPIFESYRQHEQYLNEVGAEKRPQRIRRRGRRKIATAKPK